MLRTPHIKLLLRTLYSGSKRSNFGGFISNLGTFGEIYFLGIESLITSVSCH